MELVLLLLTVHLIGDFYAQPLSWVKSRNRQHWSSKGLWKHILVHTVLNSLVLAFYSPDWLTGILAVCTIVITHLLTDVWKSYQKDSLVYFIIDQLIHIIVLLGVAAWLSHVTIEALLTAAGEAVTTHNLSIVLAYVLVWRPASILIAKALKPHTDALQAISGVGDSRQGLLYAGAWIGYLERSLALSFILLEQYTGIGFLVATKTVFRFGDLTKERDMRLTEYMILGTLLSFSVALFAGWVVVGMND